MRRGASTLIELLVVIAMIGMLISLLLPSLKRSMDYARSTVCQYRLKEVSRVMMMYRLENKGWLPTKDSASAAATMALPQNSAWFTKLFPTYLKDPTILSCPDDPYAERMKSSSARFHSPEVAEFSSYGMNSFILSAGEGEFANVERNAPSRPLDTILVADLGPDIIRSAAQSRAYAGPSRNGGSMAWGDNFDPFSGLAANPWVTARHNKGINVMTLQGHIRHVRTAEMLRNPIRRYYENCSAGGCTLCNELELFHYSFAKDRLFWWTGSLQTNR